jgi:uncharacterized protein (DUF58 family)
MAPDPLDQPEVARMLAARYGTTNRDRRLVAVIAICAAALLAFLSWATLIGATPPASGTLLTYSLSSDTEVRVTFQVRTRPGLEGPFICVLRAQDAQRIDVGYAVLDIRSTDGATEIVTYNLTTRARGRVVEVLGCDRGTEIPPTVPQPQFPPGVRAPEQSPPGRAP